MALRAVGVQHAYTNGNATNVGESSTSFGGFPLLFDLGPIGALDCFLRVSLAMLVGVPTSPAGDAQLVLPIPSDPTLVGAPAFRQWLVRDPANPLGIVTSDGIRTSFQAR